MPQARLGAQSWLAVAALILAVVAFHLPPLINCRAVHSDSAIVGIQARHMLQGEWSWFIWGAGYQGAFEPWLLAGAFAIAGSNALTLEAVPLVGYLLLVTFVFLTLRRYLRPWVALIASLPLVFTPHAVHGIAIFTPRQWSITFVFLAIWLLDGASRARRPWLSYAAGLLVAMSSLYLDLYTLQMLPAVGLLALMCSRDGKPLRGEWARRLAGGAAGLAAGALLFWLVQRLPGATTQTAHSSLKHAAHNFDLLWNTCLPFLLGTKVFLAVGYAPPEGWLGQLLRAFQAIGGASLMAAIVVGGLLIGSRKIPWEIRRLSFFALATTASSIGGFLISSMPVDLMSVRYLAPIIWTSPFAVAAFAHILKPRTLALAFAPYFVTAAVGGWLSWGPFVRGVLPVLDARGKASDELELARALREKQIDAAAAQYWLSYRLSFLWDERPVVAPLNEDQDRYWPYRRRLATGRNVAFIFHPSEPRAVPEPYEQWLRQTRARYERLAVGGFTVLVVHR